MKIFVVGAEEQELSLLPTYMRSDRRPEGVTVLPPLGIGKVNATKSLTKVLSQDRDGEEISIVLLGLCGSIYNVGNLIISNEFFEWDFDLSALGRADHEITTCNPFSESIPSVLKDVPYIQGVMATGDSFMTKKRFSDNEIIYSRYNVVGFDMEAYACAQVAKDFGCNFLCIKAVSDNVNKEGNAYQYSTALRDLFELPQRAFLRLFAEG